MPERLVALARTALREVAPECQLGELVEQGEPNEDGVRTLRFAANVPGHGGWFWVVWLAQVAGQAPTVLECDLLPGEDALLAPAWIPWDERLAEFRATHDRRGRLVVDASEESDAAAEGESSDVDELPDAEDAEDGAGSEEPEGARSRVSRRTSRRTHRRTRRRRRS